MSFIVHLLAGLFLFLKAAVRWVTLLKTVVSGVGKDAEDLQQEELKTVFKSEAIGRGREGKVGALVFEGVSLLIFNVFGYFLLILCFISILRDCKAFSLRRKEGETRLFTPTTESFFGQFTSVLDFIVRCCALCSSWVVGEESFPRGLRPKSVLE